MRWLALILLAAPAPGVAGRKLEVNTYTAAGLGQPELVRAEAGMFISKRISVEVSAGVPLDLEAFPPESLDIMLGFGATGWLVGFCDGIRPPVHSMLVAGGLRLNVLDPLEITGEGGDRGLTGEIALGYGLLTEDDLLIVRALLGAQMYADREDFAMSPMIGVTVGKAFE